MILSNVNIKRKEDTELRKDRRVNNNVNHVSLKPVSKKNFYALGFDSKSKKTVIGTFNGVTKLQAKNEAKIWASENGLRLEGVYAS